MSILVKIDQDLRQAMTSRNEVKTSTLRFLKSALKYGAIEKKQDALADTDIYQIIQKQIKQRRESIDQFLKGNRSDLASKESEELKILETYLPPSMPDAELEQIVSSQIQELGASSKKDFGRVMKALTEKLAGRADPKKISDTVAKTLK